MSDYPAAHSMDTEWFAVDADGHVAVFETGEPGPVPDSVPCWAAQGAWHECLQELLAAGTPYHASDLPRLETDCQRNGQIR